MNHELLADLMNEEDVKAWESLEEVDVEDIPNTSGNFKITFVRSSST
jgi:hypothetical protein